MPKFARFSYFLLIACRLYFVHLPLPFQQPPFHFPIWFYCIHFIFLDVLTVSFSMILISFRWFVSFLLSPFHFLFFLAPTVSFSFSSLFLLSPFSGSHHFYRLLFILFFPTVSFLFSSLFLFFQFACSFSSFSALLPLSPCRFPLLSCCFHFPIRFKCLPFSSSFLLFVTGSLHFYCLIFILFLFFPTVPFLLSLSLLFFPSARLSFSFSTSFLLSPFHYHLSSYCPLFCSPLCSYCPLLIFPFVLTASFSFSSLLLLFPFDFPLPS